jgi:hypothetical protein
MAVTVVRISPLAYRPVGQHFAQRNTRPTRVCGTIAAVEVGVAIDLVRPLDERASTPMRWRTAAQLTLACHGARP